MPEDAKRVLETWKRGDEITGDMLDVLAREFEDLLRAEYGLAQDLASAGRADDSASQLLQTNAFASAMTQLRPSLVPKLGPVTASLKAAAEALAKTLGAAHVSITVGFPGGISVSFTFDLP